MRHGWWRRNVWGLVFVLPLLVGVFALNGSGWYEANVTSTPRQPATVDGTGKATLGDYAIRILEAKPIENKAEIKAFTSFNVTLPTTVKIWRVIITVAAPVTDPPEDNQIRSCKIELLDAAGRTYSAAPSGLNSSRRFSGCSADDEKQPFPYTATNVFLLPAETTPTSVRISWSELLPRYVLLPVLP